MSLLHEIYVSVRHFAPFLVAVAVVLIGLRMAYALLIKRSADLGMEDRTPRLLAFGVLVVIGLALIFLAWPMGVESRGHMLTLLGIALTAILALSSTTFAANAMAGLMLRAVKPYKPGDFVKIGEHFGRLTERGLFHTEIQTEDRDLTTLPNLYLVSNPLTVLRSSGTIVSANLSLGYDVAHGTVEPLLLEAATDAGLVEPFVHVVELGDFSVTYRTAGFLSETKHLLSARSTLRRKILDRLHAAGIEIVSPSFMNQRALDPRDAVIPQEHEPTRTETEPAPAEQIIFDKAEAAQRAEKLHQEKAKLLVEIKELENQRGNIEPAKQVDLDRRIEQMRRQADAPGEAAAAAEAEKDAEDAS